MYIYSIRKENPDSIKQPQKTADQGTVLSKHTT